MGLSADTFIWFDVVRSHVLHDDIEVLVVDLALSDPLYHFVEEFWDGDQFCCIEEVPRVLDNSTVKVKERLYNEVISGA